MQPTKFFNAVSFPRLLNTSSQGIQGIPPFLVQTSNQLSPHSASGLGDLCRLPSLIKSKNLCGSWGITVCTRKKHSCKPMKKTNGNLNHRSAAQDLVLGLFKTKTNKGSKQIHDIIHPWWSSHHWFLGVKLGNWTIHRTRCWCFPGNHSNLSQMFPAEKVCSGMLSIAKSLFQTVSR